jgi:hypothetical protein
MNVTNEEIERTLNEKYAAYLALADKKDKLWDLVQGFIIKNHVSHPAMLNVVGSVIETYPELVVSMTDIVGYFTFPEDETTTGK